MMIPWYRRTIRLDMVEILLGLLLALVLATLGSAAWSSPATPRDLTLMNPWQFGEELAPLVEKYGSQPRYSIGVEEWLVREFFRDERDGFFVDVGAADPVRHSNTYALESRLGWSGVAVDALPSFRQAYRETRPRTVFVSYFVGDKSDETIDFHYLPGRPLSSSGDKGFAERWKSGGPVEARKVQTITLDDLLSSLQVSSIDFLSMDIELAEPSALAGFDLQRWRPRLVCIEAHREVRQQILAYFARRDYGIVGKYLRVDVNNLWFAPSSENEALPSSAPVAGAE